MVLDEQAVICPLGTESRRKEAITSQPRWKNIRKLAYIKLPGTLEGGECCGLERKYS